MIDFFPKDDKISGQECSLWRSQGSWRWTVLGRQSVPVTVLLCVLGTIGLWAISRLREIPVLETEREHQQSDLKVRVQLFHGSFNLWVYLCSPLFCLSLPFFCLLHEWLLPSEPDYCLLFTDHWKKLPSTVSHWLLFTVYWLLFTVYWNNSQHLIYEMDR